MKAIICDDCRQKCNSVYNTVIKKGSERKGEISSALIQISGDFCSKECLVRAVSKIC